MTKVLILSILVLATSCSSRSEMEYESYLVNGELMYKQNCANCHGQNGEGLRNLYPPLMGNPNLKNTQNVICVIKYGAADKIEVNGQVYDQAMPGNPRIYDLDLAQLVTFLNKEFIDSPEKVEVKEVKESLDSCN